MLTTSVSEQPKTPSLSSSSPFTHLPEVALVEKRCGSCRHYDPVKDEPDFGSCLWVVPVPFWVSDADRPDTVMAVDGLNCATHELAETAP